MFEHLRIGTKLLVSFLVVLVLTGLVAYVGYSGMSGVMSRVGKTEKANQMLVDLLNVRRHEKNFILRLEDKYVKNVEELAAGIQKEAEAIQAHSTDQINKEQMASLLKALDGYKKAFSDYVTVIKEREQLRGQVQAEEKIAGLSRKLAGIDKVIVETAREVEKQSQEYGKNQKEKMEKQVLRANRVLLVVSALAIGLGLFLTFFLSRSITLPIHNAIDVIDKIGKGDLAVTMAMGTAVDCSSIKNCGKQECPSYGKKDQCWVSAGSFAMVKHCPRALKGEDCRTCDIYGAHNEIEELGSIIIGLARGLNERAKMMLTIADGDLRQEVHLTSDKDELGMATQKMVAKLNEVLGDIQQAGEQVNSGAAQVSSASQALSQGATESASSLEEITSSMTEMGSQTKLNAGNATQANQLSGQARDAAEKGNLQMKEMVGAMNDISESAQSISKIIKVIDEIAFQTNLLALNAAVEAARAGRHGKGFAVVAEEVRNLAARSAKAAGETAELIEGSVRKTEKGTGIADRTAEALSEIVNSVGKVTDLVAEIAAASNEQAQGISQVNEGLGQIDQVTQQNTASAEQCAAAAEELSSQAGQLRQMLARFQLKMNVERQQFAAMPGDYGPPAQRQLDRSGWGGGTEGARKVKPSSVIALDDKEFGKY